MLDEACNLKLGSFSHARSLQSLPFSKTSPSIYSSPENIYMSDTRNINFWKAGDIWSSINLKYIFFYIHLVGCIFAEMLSEGIPIFELKDNNQYSYLSPLSKVL